MRLVPVLAVVLAALIPAQDDQPPTLPLLVKDLASDRSLTWQTAERKLVLAGSEAVPLLIPHLRGERDELHFMRLRVVKLLGRMGTDAKQAEAALDKLMGGRDKPLAALAARSLVQIDSEHTLAVKRLAKSTDPVSRMVACRALGWGAASGVPQLLVLIRDRHKGVRAAAGRALARIVANDKLEIAGPVLLSMLEIDSRVVRCAAIVGLGEMTNPPRSTAKKLRPLLASRNAKEGVAAIECLCALKPPPEWLLPALVARLQDRKPRVRRAAGVGLLLHSPGAVKRMFGAKDWQQRRTAAETLRWVQVEDESSPAIPLLVRLLQDPQADVRGAAAASLGELAPHSRLAMTELKLALRDRHAGVRMAALKALSVFRESEIEVPEAEMARLLDDQDASVRAAALGALPTLALDAPVLDKLIDLLADGDVRIRRAVFRKLQMRVQTRGHPFDVTRRKRAFAAALVMPDSNLRRQTRAALRLRSYEPKGEEFLLRFLEHQNPKVRAEAATTFGEMGKAAKKHLPKLRKLLEDPEPRVRVAAERAIAEIEGSGKKGPGTERLKQLQRLR